MRNVLRYGLVLVLVSAVLTPRPAPVRAAVAVANGVVGDGTPASCTYAELLEEMASPAYITFACGAAPHTIILTAAGGVQPAAGQATTLDGGGLITLSAGNVADRRLFSVGPSATLTLTHMTLTNALMVSEGGGALLNRGRLVVDGVVIKDSGAQGIYGGGAIFNEIGTLLVRNSILRNNYSAGGGAVFVNPGTHAVIESSTFLSNTVPNGEYGGAISNHGTLTITTSSFVGNRLTLISPCSGSPNICGGGAITNLNTGLLLISLTTFSGNTTNQSAGAILNKGLLSLEDSALSGNSATSAGGALANVYTATAYLTRVDINGNQSSSAGGLFNYAGSAILLVNVTLRNNLALGSGGGLMNAGAVATLNQVTFSGNIAHMTGGGIENRDQAGLTMNNSTLTGNMATSAGAAIWNFLGSANLTFVTVSSNTSQDSSSAGLDNYNHAHSSLYLGSTLLVNNQPANCAGKAPSTPTYNLSTDATCFTAINGNQLSTPQLLGPLANNGGLTLTQLPAPGSAAINNGQCVGGLDFDQRGLPRLVGVGCDIGAVERQAVDYGWYLALPLVLR